MENFVNIMSIIGAGAFLMILGLIVYVALRLYLVYRKNVNQPQHSILRGFPLMGKIRYIFESMGPELRQYWFNSDTEGKPFSRFIFVTIVKMGKYASTIIPFGSKRDFAADGFFLRPTPFPLNIQELKVNLKKINSYVYNIIGYQLFGREEQQVEKKLNAWGLAEEDYIIIGKGDPLITTPFVAKSFIGASGMAYGTLGKNATRAISIGTATAETWMNTGEGALTPYHLEGGGQIIYQLGGSFFGSRNLDGTFSEEKFTNNMSNTSVVACEIKLHQGAKIKGGLLPKAKLTQEIADIRGVPMGEDVVSPNRNPEFHDTETFIKFIARLKQHSCGKPIGMKMVVGQVEEIDKMFQQFATRGMWPNFITIDGGEGGSGATNQEMADTLALPIFEALPIVVELLKKHGLREKITVFASGKLVTADQIAIALCLGADGVNTARGMLMSVGCIMADICDTNACPTGVTTNDPEREKVLVVNEKKYRVTNYILTLRQGVFSLGAACGITSPRHFSLKHLGYRKSGKTMRGEKYIEYLMKDQLPD